MLLDHFPGLEGKKKSMKPVIGTFCYEYANNGNFFIPTYYFYLLYTLYLFIISLSLSSSERVYCVCLQNMYSWLYCNLYMWFNEAGRNTDTWNSYIIFIYLIPF